MSERDNGGPAFPLAAGWVEERSDGSAKTIVTVRELDRGMTLRDYFIAHAPAEPWPEFDPVMPIDRPLSRWAYENAPADGPRFHSARAAEIHYQCSDEYVINEAADEQNEWSSERNLQRRIQWPSYWADTQLKARKA